MAEGVCGDEPELDSIERSASARATFRQLTDEHGAAWHEDGVAEGGDLVPTEMLMEARAEGASRRVRVAALLLIAGLLAGPVGTHVYWMVGGAWGLQGTANTLGIRIVAAAVVMLLVAAILVVLARAGFWQQAIVPDRVIRLLTWGLAVFFLGHGAGSGGAWPRLHWPHRTLPSH